VKRRLPLLVERSVGQVDTLRQDLSDRFELAVKTNANVSCRAGCSHCCYHPISISILEAIAVYRWLVKNHRWTTGLKKRVQEAADRQIGVSYEVWLLSLIPCPLLNDEKLCSAYEARPLVCRTYFSLGDPHYCHPHRLGENTKMVPREELVKAYHNEQTKVLRRHRLQLTTLPIGSALLLAEQICEGETELSNVDKLIFKEYLDHA